MSNENINWENAPKEATHHSFTSNGQRNCWWMLSSEGNWYHLYEKHQGGGPNPENDWQRTFGDVNNVDKLTKRPGTDNPPWDGVGLSPLGQVVEALFTTDNDPDWFEFTLLGRGPNRFFGTVRTFGSCSSPVEGMWPNAKIGEMKFRKLTTEAQRKEERIANKIDKIMGSYKDSYDPEIHYDLISLIHRLASDGWIELN